MFSFGKNKSKNKLKIVFHDAVATIGEHGTIYADSVKHNFKNQPVSFAFIGVEQMPQMDVETLKQIEHQAAAAGFVMIGLRSYATVVPVMPRPRLNMSGPNPNAMKVMHPGQVRHIPQRPSNPGFAEGQMTRGAPPKASTLQGRHWKNPTTVVGG